MKFTMVGEEKKWPFDTGDCLIEVTSWSGLTVPPGNHRNRDINDPLNKHIHTSIKQSPVSKGHFFSSPTIVNFI
jgi:hypothetical protein